MRVLVTGSEGFLGRRLVLYLESNGWDVVRFDAVLGDDVRTLNPGHTKFEAIDACVHLAAVSDLYIAEDHPSLTYDVNVNGTQRIRSSCEHARARLLFASTCCAYGNNGWSVNTEEAPLCPTETYARSKVQAELVLDGCQVPYAILRLGTFYGPGQRDTLMTEIFPRQAASGGPIFIHGDGMQNRGFIHVDDVCSGIHHVLINSEVTGVVNIASEHSVTVEACAQRVSEVVGGVDIIYGPDRDGQIHSSRINVDRLKSLGWKERHEVLSFVAERATILERQLAQRRNASCDGKSNSVGTAQDEATVLLHQDHDGLT